VRAVLYSVAVLALGATPAMAADRIAETCSGSEMVQIGSQPARMLPYSVSFSADLATGYVCYGECKPEHTYRIADARADPIKLADLNIPGQQVHLITFDPKTSRLTDRMEVDLLHVKTTRLASVSCEASAFSEPPVPQRG